LEAPPMRQDVPEATQRKPAQFMPPFLLLFRPSLLSRS
jgi:hypothetical protein